MNPQTENSTDNHKKGLLCYGSFERLLIVPNLGTAENPRPDKHCPIADLGEGGFPDFSDEWECERYANARRLVACWNVCEGLATEGLENLVGIGESITVMNDRAISGQLKALGEAHRLEVQRDELLEALNRMVCNPNAPNLAFARAAISKCK